MFVRNCLLSIGFTHKVTNLPQVRPENIGLQVTKNLVTALNSIFFDNS